MKISYVLGHELPFPPKGGGGVNSLLNAVTKAMARQGHEVTAYSPAFPGAATDEVIAGVRHLRVKGAPRHPSNIQNQIRGLPYAIRVRSIIEPCDVLNCHLLSSFVFKPLRNAKVVTHTIHREPKKVLALTALLDRIYTGSEAVSEEAGHCVPWLKSKIKTVHNCVEFEDYTERMPSKRADFTFIYVGRFSRDKGIETLVRGFIAVAKTNHAVRLIVVGPQTAEGGGEPDFFHEMRRLVATSGVAERISFLPPVYDRQELDDLIRTADVVCLPSLGGETLNMSVLECLRLSTPTLISDLPANLPLVENGVSGFFARVGNVEDWAKMMGKMADLDEVRFAEMGRSAYRYGLNNFASDAIAKRYVEDFHTLLGTR
jgi:glycosyltransferase involved in cell wall biosynthesis